LAFYKKIKEKELSMNNSKRRRLFLQYILTVFFIVSGLVMGQSPPTAATGAASAIGSTDATLNGTVNANGVTTTVFFEYGITIGYGSTETAAQSPVTGSTDTAVNAVIYELLPNTTYHYRVVAQGTHGTTFGADMTFTTLPSPPIAITDVVSAIGVDSATLNGTVNPLDSSTSVTFQYGTDTSYGNTVTADQSPLSGSLAVGVSKTITGLVGNITYHYRVVAVNAGGTTYGADMTFTINASAPTAVTNAATAVGNDIATLNGTVNANGSLTTVTFEYGLDTSYGSTINAIQSPLSGTIDTAVSAIIDDVVPNTSYHCRVVAQNAGGTTYSTDMTFTTLPNAPTAVTNMASAVGTTGATLNGTVNANEGSTTVSFQYGTDTNYGSNVTADQSPVSGSTDTAVSKAITGLSTGVTYHYRVVAVNAGGSTYGADMTFTTGSAAPAATTNAASGLGTTTATLNGTVNANNDSTTVTFQYGTSTSYGRTVTADQSPVTGSSNTAVSKSPSDLIPATTYHYRVVAENSSGTTYGADMTFTTRAAPTVITNAATAVNGTGAALNGIVNANSDSTTVTFEYGLTSAYGSAVTADQSPVTGNTNIAVSKVLTDLTANATYHYRVVGQNVNGTTYGADMTFFTAAPSAPTAATNAATLISSSGATLNGMVNANNADTTVTFEYGTTTSYGSTVTADQSPVTGAVAAGVSKAITGLVNNTTYHYRVVAVNAYGTAYGSDMTFSTGNAPAATTNAATGVGASFAALNGTVNANNFTTTVTFEYGTTTSYGSTVTADQSPVIGTDNTAVSKTITGLLPNTTYHYRVKAQGFGTSFGQDMTFTTGSGPSATTNAASSVGSTTATLNGTVNANNLSTTVTFEYGLNTSYGKLVTADQSPVTGSTNTAVSKGLTSLVPNTTYHYRVVASNANDTVHGADMTFTTGSSAPTAATNAATAVSTTGATLNGTVNANSDSTTVTFEYGLDTSYGSTVTAAQSPVTGNSNTAVSAVLTGLTSNTTYHYRVVAQNSSGTTYGADMTFFTDPSGPTATTQAASNVGNTSATLNGTVNANNNQTTVTFEFGPSTAYIRTYTADQNPVTGSSDTAVSFNVTGLTQNTTYHYRVMAQSSSGTTYGADMTFTTNAPKPTVTTQPASNINATSAALNGLVNANNDSTTVTFEYGTNTGYGTIVTADQSPVTGSTNTAVSANITGLLPNTTYHYRVVGQNSGGTRNGADMTFTTDTSLPTVTTAAASNIEPDSAVLNGLVNANNDSTTVTFEYGVDTSYGNTVTADQSPVTGSTDTAISANVTGLASNTTYHYRVKGQNSSGTNYGSDMTFTTLPPRTPTVTTAPVTKITFHTAKSGGNVIDEGASPVTARGVCWSTAPNPTTVDNFTTNDSGPGPFNSTMNQLTEKTTYYVRAYATNSYGTAYGEEFQFITNSKAVSVTLVKPKDGDVLSGTVNIQAVARATKGEKITKVEFYIDDTKIAQHSKVPYKTDWDTTSYPDGSYTIKAVATNTVNESSQDSIGVTVNNLSTTMSTITLNRGRFIYRAVPFGKKDFLSTSPQELEIRTSAGAQLEWTISTDAGWLSTSTASGKGPGVVIVYVDVKSMAAGSYSASLKIMDPKTSNVMASVTVQLIVLEKNASLPPFGGINMPMDSVIVNDDVPISGWALDDIEVTSVKIYRAPLHHEGSDHIYLGDAVMLDGARPDLEENYPDFPLNYKAGWGYLLKTYSLPNQGNGTFTLYAKAEDKEGNIVTLGSKTITVDNTNGVKPFGAIEKMMEAVSEEGLTLVNEGWTLTPQPYTIPFDGSTITVWVDGLPTGSPVYNQFNKEIAALFPDANNKDGAGGYFILDTTSLTHGVHSIAWLVEDDARNNNAVDFQYFSIDNLEMPGGENSIDLTFNSLEELKDLVPRQMEPVFFNKGYGPYEESGVLLPDAEGINTVTIKELEPFDLQLGKNIAAAQGFLVTGGYLRDLPVGSTLDHKSGLFSWLPGPGHFGKYLMVLVMKDMEGQYTRTLVRITIEPKFNK
jgi:phosphodiesterase/alkaline phosphatase D-like protein